MKVTSYFENHKNIIGEQLSKAQKEVIIGVAWINFNIYFDIFNDLLERKIKLKIICTDNPSNRNHIVEINKLSLNGAEIKLLQMPNSNSHMHHKFAVIDSKTIMNGSFNWSKNAIKSFENLMIIEDCPEECRKFKREFDRILQLEKSTIKHLQKFVKCKNCDGEMLNILVFSERSSKYFETYGDVVKACNCCMEYETMEECIQDTQLYMLVNSLNGSSDDYEYEYLNDLIFKELNSFTNTEIHAIGKVKTTYDHHDDEDVETVILWKNKFVGDRLEDSIDNDFGVYYDN